MRGAIDSILPVDELSESGGEFLVCSVSRSPEGVAAQWRYGVVVQVCDPRRLTLVDKVGVPCCCAKWFAKAGRGGTGLVVEIWPDDSGTGDAWDLGGLGLYRWMGW